MNNCRCNVCGGNILSNANEETASEPINLSNNAGNALCRCNGIVESAVLSNANNNEETYNLNNMSNMCRCNNTQNNSFNCSNGNLLNALCNYIGRRGTFEFETGRGIETKNGMLEGVGNNYLVLRSCNNNKIMYCNTCNLLFVTISG